MRGNYLGIVSKDDAVYKDTYMHTYTWLNNFNIIVNLSDLKFIFAFTTFLWFVLSKVNCIRKLPPGPWGIPFFGYLPFIKRKAPHSWYLETSARYGDVCSVQMGSNLVVCIGSAKLLKELFCKNESTGRPHTPLNELLGGHGIVLSEGILWKRQRYFLLEKFRALGVKLLPNQRFEKFIIMEVAELLKKLKDSNSAEMDPMNILGRHIHNVICQLMMSFRFNENNDEFDDFNEKISRGMKLYGSVHIGEHIKQYLKLPGKKAVVEEIKRNLSEICKFHGDHVTERINYRETTSDSYEPADLLDHYLEKLEAEGRSDNSVPIFPGVDPKKQIVQVMNDLFSAGMETSRTTLAWTLIMMVREPLVAQKVRADLREVVAPGQLVLLEHRSQLPYVEAVLFETLRRVSVVPLGTTHVNTKSWNINGYTIPAGSHIIPLINKMNMDPELYHDPEMFKPERFLREGALYVPDYFMQFGAGQRMCLGAQLARMELFLFFANIMNSVTFSLPEGRELPGLEGYLAVTHAPRPYSLCFSQLDDCD